MRDSAQREPVRAARPVIVLLVVGLGTLLTAMSGSAVTLALPSLGRELGASLERTGWVMEAFLLTVTVLLLPAGRAADALGHAGVYRAGFVLFGVASGLCGAAPTLELLVGARVLQGAAGAMVMASGPALLTTSFVAEQRGRALGLLATATYTGLTIGPPLGGLLIAALGWRSVFLLNVPIAALIAVASWRLLASRRERRAAVDWRGTAALLLGLPLLLAALTQGRIWGWTSAATLGAAAAGLVALGVFTRIEARHPDPLLDVRLFRSRLFTGSTASALCNYVALFVSIILLPYYLVEARGMTAAQAGLLLAAQPIVMALVASPAGWLSDRIGSRALAAAGLFVLAAGLAWIATVGPATPVPTVAAAQAVMGLGTGIFISPNSSALMGSAPRGRQGVAASVLAVARNLGMMLGVGVGTTVFFALGGRTGGRWHETDYRALRLALLGAAAVSAVGAVLALLRGRGTEDAGAA